MLNDNYAADTPLFALGQHEGRVRLIFTTAATLDAKVPEQRPLWWYEPADVQELHALTVWFGEYRELWPAWRDIVERDGIQAISDEFERLWGQTLEACRSIMMSGGETQRELVFSAMLATRESQIVRHRFATARHRLAFAEWFLMNLEACSAILLFEGCLIGPEHVGRIMDQIAEQELARTARKRSPAARRARGAVARRRAAA